MATANKVVFHFKKRSIRDESGAVIGHTKKQPSVEAELIVPSAQEIAAALAADPESAVSKLIVASVQDTIVDAARGQFDDAIEAFGDDDSKEVNASMLDHEKLTLTYIASIPPTQRASTALTEEDYNNFFEDYKPVIMHATGKEAPRVDNHINLLKKPAKIRNNVEFLKVLIQHLDIYMAKSENLEETGAVAVRIRAKLDKWLTEASALTNADLL